MDILLAVRGIEENIQNCQYLHSLTLFGICCVFNTVAQLWFFFPARSLSYSSSYIWHGSRWRQREPTGVQGVFCGRDQTRLGVFEVQMAHQNQRCLQQTQVKPFDELCAWLARFCVLCLDRVRFGMDSVTSEY